MTAVPGAKLLLGYFQCFQMGSHARVCDSTTCNLIYIDKILKLPLQILTNSSRLWFYASTRSQTPLQSRNPPCFHLCYSFLFASLFLPFLVSAEPGNRFDPLSLNDTQNQRTLSVRLNFDKIQSKIQYKSNIGSDTLANIFPRPSSPSLVDSKCKRCRSIYPIE